MLVTKKEGFIEEASNPAETVDLCPKEPISPCQSGQELLRGSFRGTHVGLGGHVQNSTDSSNSHLEISHGVI